MRYVDLTVNQHVKDTFVQTNKMFNAMRLFLMTQDILKLKLLFYNLLAELQRPLSHINSLTFRFICE
jgi:hypothetical protein